MLRLGIGDRFRVLGAWKSIKFRPNSVYQIENPNTVLSRIMYVNVLSHTHGFAV